MVTKISDKHSMVAISIAVLSGAILPCLASAAYESAELAFILSCNPIQNAPRVDRVRAPSYLSYATGGKLFLIGVIRFYQRFISPQDMPTCNFVPSCSQFGAEAIKQLGIVRGILLTSDRLQRCNGVSTSHYETDHGSGKLIDPVQIYCEILQ